ncbi:VOC family protein [Erysipelothrix urinaevulpis]|uniref:VOC family protein n=1 Tax=Erysipelothrix urinaevulpis TaxID=2683717 RepID=UPI00135C23CB|nr:VOC family protein [Erysipelothrix urinaevulpis]
MKLDMIGIIVENMEASLQFYKTLGFEVSDVAMENYVELVSENIRISLNTKEMISGVYGFEPQLTGERIELAFLCDSTDELELKVKAIKDSGYKVFKEPWNAVWGQYYAIVLDADGNYISLFCNGLKEN